MNKGQSLIEVLVALSAIILILGAITAIVLTSLSQASKTKLSSEGSRLAQEGLEHMKIVEMPTADSYCMDDRMDLLPYTTQNCLIKEGAFRREVRISRTDDCGTTLSEVTVEVSWRDSSCTGNTYCLKTPITTCL